MKQQITVIDYGLGNLLSIRRAFEHWGASVNITDSLEAIRNARGLVLPGVGAFQDGMRGLMDRRLIDPIKNYVATGRPFLGICLGMQMLLDHSEEFGVHEGLKLIPGTVSAIPATKTDGIPHKVPHIGWNELKLPESRENWVGTILSGTAIGSCVYFVHSFTAVPLDPKHRLADCYYNGRLISAAIALGNIYGCQFHPEKSGAIGLSIIKNFVAKAAE